MMDVLLLLILLLAICASAETNASPRPPSQLHANPARFSPCRLTGKIAASSKKRTTKLFISLLTSCGLRLIPLAGDEWGPPERAIALIPRTKHMACLVVRALYSFYSNGSGVLPRRLSTNALPIYETVYKLIHIGFTDTSIASEYCSRKSVPGDPAKNYCFPKDQLLWGLNVVYPCVREALRGSMPERADHVIHGLLTMIRASVTNGFLQYLCG